MSQRSAQGLINELERFVHDATRVPLDYLGNAVSDPVEGCSDALGEAGQSAFLAHDDGVDLRPGYPCDGGRN